MSTAVSASGSALIFKSSTTASKDTGFASLNSIYAKKRYAKTKRLALTVKSKKTVLASNEDASTILAGRD
jgi:hypothetical protein